MRLYETIIRVQIRLLQVIIAHSRARQSDFRYLAIVKLLRFRFRRLHGHGQHIVAVSAYRFKIENLADLLKTQL